MTDMMQASIAGISGSIAAPLYCATKHAIVGFVKSLIGTEALTGVKVTTICPGLVNTPLFTPSKQQQFSFVEQNALTPESVAGNMINMLTKKEWECGSMLELSMSGPRRIPEWNIDPPAGQGTGQELNADLQGAFKAMLKPIEAKLNAEKMAKL
jgi:NAD(P)-dependent dehydrogenase (short-subunit alcohol dehydrogenase family)